MVSKNLAIEVGLIPSLYISLMVAMVLCSLLWSTVLPPTLRFP